MVTSPESGTNNGENTVQKARQDIQDEITAAVTEAQKQALAEKLRQELRDAETPAKEVVDDIKKSKTIKHEVEGKQALRTLVRITEAIKKGIPVVENKPNAQKILTELADKSLSASTAASIETNLKDYLLGDKDIELSREGEQKSSFENDFDSLKQTNSIAAQLIADSLANQAAAFGVSKDDIRNKFQVPEDIVPPPDGQREPPAQMTQEQLNENQQRMLQDQLDTSLRYDTQQYYGSRFTTPEERDFLEALYDGNKFVDYVKARINPSTDSSEKSVKLRDNAEKSKRELREQLEKEYQRTKQTMSEAEINNRVNDLYRDEVSKDIKRTIVNMLDQIHVQLARERASKSYDEIAREDFMHGVAATTSAMKRAIEGLARALEHMEKDPNLKNIMDLKLYVHTEVNPEVLDVNVPNKERLDGSKTNKALIRLKQLPRPKEVSLSEFVKNLELEMTHFQHSRQYLHDGRSIYSHPAGEKGFYNGLGGYSEHMQTPDVDSLLSLPDGALVLEAFQMYDKYLDEQFALQDWRHEPSQFTSKHGAFETHLEGEVLEALQRMHPDYDQERLKSALYMGVGMSRAIFLNEPEKAAFADPVLQPDGTMTGTSYYTNDVSALLPFNPIHMYMRWQGEPNIYPFLFFPTDEKGIGAKGPWNHMKAWDEMKMFKDSYFKGRKAYGDRKLFIDDLINFTNTGGPAQRKGWRSYFSNEGNFIFKIDANGQTTHTIDAAKTWKTLEKIGFDVMHDFVANNRIPEEVLKAKGSGAKDRQELFEHLFKTYFQNEGDLEAYLANIRKGSRHEVIKDVREGKAAPASLDEAIEENVSKVFLFRTLSRMVGQRIPTKLLRIDRDRFSDTGKSRWKDVRDKMGWSSEKFDMVMKNLGLAESLLRKEVSDEIRTRLKISGKSDLKDLDSLTDILYKLDAAKVRDLLTRQQQTGAQGLGDEEINNVVKLFEKINSEYSGNTEFLDKFGGMLKSNFYPFSFALDEFDISLLAFRGAGPRMIPRAIKDLGKMEEVVMSGCIGKLKDILPAIATNGKKDVSELINILKAVKEAYGDVHGYEAGYKAIEKIAAATITFFKKDTMSKGFLGLTRIGKKNSLAAEYAGRSSAVWEWDATDIDNFIVALETNRLLPRDPYDHSKPPSYEPIYINTPFSPNPLKLPEKLKLPFKRNGKNIEINLFRRRVKDYKVWYSDKLRKDFGGKWYDISFDFIVKYGPLFAAFLLYKFIKDALEEAQGTKKK